MMPEDQFMSVPSLKTDAIAIGFPKKRRASYLSEEKA
jgi:hypothetical protein